MTTGALIFAQNNLNIDYVKLANFCASRVQKFLNIPVSIITDSKEWLELTYPNHNFDQIIEVEQSQGQKRVLYDGTLSSVTTDWKNFSRYQVYNLSPYETTIVLDSDYVLNSSILRLSLDQDYDFQIYKNSFDLAGWRPSAEFKRINQYSVPFYWATVFVFKKSVVVKSFFDLIFYIRENWEYFRVLYNVDNTLFRNDYAFSIAIHIMNGKTNGEFAAELPGTMAYTTDRDLLVNVSDNKMQFLVEKEHFLGEYIAAKTTGIDMHVMNKLSLSRMIDEVQNV